ncbi:MAG: ABC transporter substrate-binding protein [Planctomycetota bacterium]
MKWTSTVGMWLAVWALVLGVGETGKAFADETKVVFRSAFPPSGSLTAPFAYTAALGLYKKAGLAVTIEDGIGALATAKDIAAGNTYIGVVSGSTLAQGIAEGMPIVSVAMLYGRSSFGVIVPKDSPITSIQSLKGHSVVTSPGSAETILLPAALKAVRLNMSDVKVLSVAATAKVSTYIQGQADSLGTSLPFFLPIIGDSRPSKGVLFASVGAGFPDFSLVVHSEYLKKNPKVVEAFLRATYEGLKRSLEDPKAAVGALADIRKALTNPRPQELQLAAFKEYVCSDGMRGRPVGWHSPEEWRAGLAVLEEFGGLKGKVSNPDRFYTNQFFAPNNPASGAWKCE